MFGFRSTADRFQVSCQADRSAWLQVVEIAVCGFIGHRQSLLHYAAFEVVELFDEDENVFYEMPQDVDVPYVGCMRCLAEIELELPAPTPVDIVDWR